MSNDRTRVNMLLEELARVYRELAAAQEALGNFRLDHCGACDTITDGEAAVYLGLCMWDEPGRECETCAVCGGCQCRPA